MLVDIIAGEKLLLLVSVAVFAWLLFRFNRPWAFAILAAVALAGSVAILLAPLRTMLGGNTGDEQYISAFLMRVRGGQPFADFYYRDLPPFYPPLYFWITGLVSWPFVSTGIGAAKIGAVLASVAWFVIPYFTLKRAESPWFRVLMPMAAILLVDPYAHLLKPYESLSAMLCVLWLGSLAQALREKDWPRRRVFLFGLTGGLLFMTYHFWWFVMAPAMLALAWMSPPVMRNLKRIAAIIAVMIVVALPYLVPLLLSFARYGYENWQSSFFVIDDLSTFAPWTEWSAVGFLALAGVVGLLKFRATPFVRAAGLILLAAFAWQGVNLVIMLLGGKPTLAGKPFLFLGAAALAVGAAHAAIELGHRVASRYGNRTVKWAALVAMLVLMPALPFGRFIETPKLQAHLEADLAPRGEPFLAENIRLAVPDWRERVWLTSGTASLNAYLPLNYFLAHNEHFSHPAAGYTERLAIVRALAATPTPDAFARVIDTQTDITALAFYKEGDAPNPYPVLVWLDAYPNGGREERIELSRGLVDEAHWRNVKEDNDWVIFVRR